MKILIVEDETAAYETLVDLLNEIDPSIEVVGNTESVTQTIRWLQTHVEPDLILMDIHLSDGDSFLIFKSIPIDAPIIFTTAYDEYAIDAFKVNSIDYLLKPIQAASLVQALQKFKRWTKGNTPNYLALTAQIEQKQTKQRDRILVLVKDKLLPIELKDVAMFYSTGGNTMIYLNNGSSYPYASSLDQLMPILPPLDFYRANRQFVIAKKSIENLTIWFDSRLRISLHVDAPEPIYISKNKAADFKEWMVS